MIWEIKSASTSRVTSICPSCDGHRVLVGYYDGSVRMWNLDLENLAINQADNTDPRDDGSGRQVTVLGPSRAQETAVRATFKVLIEGSQISTVLDLPNSGFCRKWTECIDQG